MSTAPETHCRLCAEKITDNQSVSINDETGIKSSLENKLQWLCVDVTPSNSLPKCVCHLCFDVLTRTWSFLHQVRVAQEKLTSIYGGKISDRKSDTSGGKMEKKTEQRDIRCQSSDPESSDNATLAEKSKKTPRKSKRNKKCKPEELIVEVDVPNFQQKSKRKKASKSEVTCFTCNREFEYPCMLNRHKKAVHTERTKEFNCHVCGMMFYTKHTMAAHLSVHEDTKPFKCSYCPRAFRARRNLKTHILTHSAEKPFPCEICGKTFLNGTYLKKHAIIHTDIMPYACEICDKRFRQPAKLQIHQRQHTGVKPYRCQYCGRDFTNGSNHYKHMKRRHNVGNEKKEKVLIENLNAETVERLIPVVGS